ncbi:MAG: PfkB family carbohydrate kinase, partial [Defluviitaleaceae bacterium]|nr:PfkB family carbohydrate kinase [Defluviitaleaceae bacterium]
PIEVCQANSNHPPKRGDCDTNIAERFNWCRNILVVSGSRPQGVAADFYAKICKLHPGKIFLDTEGEALKIALETAPPFAIKPNLFELESLFQKKDLSDIKVKNFSSPEEIAEICRKKIIPYGVKIVCVSMGAEGAVLVAGDSAENSFFLPALNLPVKGVAGAGDAMVAGMVYSMAYEITAPERLLSSGMAAAAASVVLDGTEMCTADGFINFGKKLATPRSCRF